MIAGLPQFGCRPPQLYTADEGKPLGPVRGEKARMGAGGLKSELDFEPDQVVKAARCTAIAAAAWSNRGSFVISVADCC